MTILALDVLPWIYFPNDQYAVPALWVMGTGISTLITWSVVTVFGKIWVQRIAQNATT
ncbi:hypothetical protein IIA15_06225 [candidate division TA06 bacterium]|nr:hypothetical protein [candidate division TA06 bacterium]